MIISFLQKLIRNHIVKDRSINIKFNSSRETYRPNGSYQYAYTRKGGVLAQYAGRFILISYDDFSSIMLERITNLEELLAQYPALQNKKDTQSYINEYNKIVNDFYTQYKKRERKNDRIFKTINEEFSHHKLIRDTPTYVILNSLTIYYRICSCYLTHHRYYGEKIDVKVLESLINTYLIRSHITEITYPIVEASYHYHDDPIAIESQYGEAVKKWCEIFRVLEKKISILNKERVTDLMEMVQKSFLSYPYISAITQDSKIDFKKFIQCYDRSYMKLNHDLLRKINSIIDAGGNVIELESLLKREKEERLTNTQLDKSFFASLIYLGTEQSDDFIPKSLKKFVIKQLITCKNKKVLKTIFQKSGDVDDAYSDYPPVKCIGDENHTFCIDKSMEIFEEDSFVIAQNSFEPTFAGENGFKTISESPICNTLLIQTLLIKSLSLVLFKSLMNDKPLFLKEFDLLLSAMPKNYKKFIKDIVLPLYFDESKKILLGYNSTKELNIKEIAEKFEESVKYLQDKVSLWDDNESKSFYTFCDINYVHGY